MTTESKNLWQRLAEAQTKVDYVQKEKKLGMSYSIISHDAVTAKVRPVLVECGIHYHPVALQFNQNGNRTEVALTVRFVNVDKPTEFIDVPSLGYGIDTQDKGPGKAISYAVKYALLKTLGLETGDDPDFDQNAKHEPNKKPEMVASIGNSLASKNANKIEYDLLTKEIRDQTGVKALSDWYNANFARIEKIPTDWIDTLRIEYTDKLNELKQKAAP